MTKIAIAAQLACIDIYEPINKQAFSKIFTVGETVCGIAIIENVLYAACQGTSNRAGWVADFDCESDFHPILGQLHHGFNENIDALISLLLPNIPLAMEVVICGHSKGAGEGSILAAKLKLHGINVSHCILLACPNSGNQQFSDWMKKNIPGISLRNAPKYFSWLGDPVPLVPDDGYVPPYPHTAIDEQPSGLSCLLPTSWHNAHLYWSGALDWDLSNAE